MILFVIFGLSPFLVLKISVKMIYQFLWWIVTDLSISGSSLNHVMRNAYKFQKDSLKLIH